MKIAELGLSLTVSEPSGIVQDDRPVIAYTVKLSRNGRVIYDGPYTKGVGHVKVPKYETIKTHFNKLSATMGGNEYALLQQWAQKPNANFMNKELWATVAAKLAKVQKVGVTLSDILYSIMLDSSADLDAMTFKDWSSEYGHSDDSIKARDIYDIFCVTGRNIRAAFSADEIKELREWTNEQ